MTSNIPPKIELFDLEFERFLQNLLNLVEIKLSPKRKGKETMAYQQGEVASQSLMNYAQPSLLGTTTSIRRQAIQANNFVITPVII